MNRAAFFGDGHTWRDDAQPGALSEAILEVDALHYYFAGDMFDFWAVSDRPPSRSAAAGAFAVLEALFIAAARRPVTYIVGNHDDLLLGMCGLRFGNIEVVRRAVHVGADGRSYGVEHGDPWDESVRHRGLALAATRMARAMGFFKKRRSSLADAIENAVDGGEKMLKRFRASALRSARRAGHAGQIASHTHRPALEIMDGLLYGNCGDWLKHRTYIVEEESGEWALRRHA